jgi:hypothetical protein
MTTINKATVTELKNEVLHGTKFNVCPSCRFTELLKFDVDHFCTKCDWNSVLHDVNSGNFEKRIGVTVKNRSRRPEAGRAEVAHLSHYTDESDTSQSANRRKSAKNR